MGSPILAHNLPTENGLFMGESVGANELRGARRAIHTGDRHAFCTKHGHQSGVCDAQYPGSIVEGAKGMAEVVSGLERGTYQALNAPVHGNLQEQESTAHAILGAGEALLELLLR